MVCGLRIERYRTNGIANKFKSTAKQLFAVAPAAVPAQDMSSMYYAMLPGVVPGDSQSPRASGDRSRDSSNRSCYVKSATIAAQDAHGLGTEAGGHRSPGHTSNRPARQTEHLVDTRTPPNVLVSVSRVKNSSSCLEICGNSQVDG